MRTGLFKTLSLLLLPVASLTGCTTSPYCDALDKCGGYFLEGGKDLGGGVPAVEWVASLKDDACVDQVPNPPSPPSASLIPPRPAGVRAIEPSTLDWCAGLVISIDGSVQFDDGWYETLKRYYGWFPSVPLYTAQLEILQNNQYAVTTTQLASQHYDLSQTCLVAQGVSLSCDDLSTRIKASVEKTLASVDGLTALVYGNPGRPSFCAATKDNGCACDYNVSLTTTTTGPWSQGTAQINFFDAQAAPPGAADYCANASGLHLTGAKGTDLFNRTSLKTLNLRAPSCNDNVQSKTLGEEGIDCGGQCGPCQ
jgi:hypothetical protein